MMEKQKLDGDNINQFLSKLINLTDGNQRYLDRINLNFILKHFDAQFIEQIEKIVFKGTSYCDMNQFIKGMLDILKPQRLEILYVIMAVIDLYNEVLNDEQNNVILFKQLTDYICESIENKNDDFRVNDKMIPQQSQFNRQRDNIRAMDLDPPILIGKNNDNLVYLSKGLDLDNQHHKNGRIKGASFVEQNNKIITLDQLTQKLDVYNIKCDRLDSILPPPFGSESDRTIICFYYSQKEQRIGALLKEQTLCFWDLADGYKYCKSFSINTLVTSHQTNIWYLEYYQVWITGDLCGNIYQWDIIEEKIQRKLGQLQFQIIDIVEICYLQLIAFASSNKILYVYKFKNLVLLQTIQFSEGGINQIKFNEQFQVLLCLGFYNYVKIYSVDNISHDFVMEGQLLGHQSLISAIQIIKSTPTVITCDDRGVLKLWDIRSFGCYQTISIGMKTSIHTILDISVKSKICLAGSRLYVMQFEKRIQRQDQLIALRIEFDSQRSELIICTQKDIRFYDMRTGKMIRVINNLSINNRELNFFRMLSIGNCFILCYQDGNIGLYNYNGQLIQKIDQLSQGIDNFKFDRIHNLFIVTSSYHINIYQRQKQQKDGKLVIKLRTINNNHQKQQISCLDVSVYHNLIFTGCQGDTVNVYNYEFGRIMAIMKLNDGEPIILQCINGYSLLIVGTNNNHISFIQFHQKTDQIINFRVMIVANISSILNKNIKDEGYPINMLCDIEYKSKYQENELRQVEKFNLFLGMNNGWLVQLDLTQEMQQTIANHLVFVPCIHNKAKYNCYRQSSEDSMQYESQLIKQSLKIHFEVKQYQENENDFNYQDQNKEIKVRQVIIAGNHNLKWYDKIHSKSINSLQFLDNDRVHIISASIDGGFKIFKIDGQNNIMLVCNNNINHPLPTKWKLSLSQLKKYKQKIIYAITQTDLMSKKYQQPTDKNRYSLQPLFELVLGNQKLPLFIQDEQINKIYLMKDEYDKRDFQLNQQQFSELKGPNLYVMNKKKQFQTIQNDNLNDLIKREQDQQNYIKFKLQKQNDEEYQQEFNNVCTLLDKNYQQKILNPLFGDRASQIKQKKLIKKLDEILQNKTQTITNIPNNSISHKHSYSTNQQVIQNHSKESNHEIFQQLKSNNDSNSINQHSFNFYKIPRSSSQYTFFTNITNNSYHMAKKHKDFNILIKQLNETTKRSKLKINDSTQNMSKFEQYQDSINNSTLNFKQMFLNTQQKEQQFTKIHKQNREEQTK